MNNDTKLRRARKYLAQRGLSATAKDSKFIYRDKDGRERPQPDWLKPQEESTVIVLDDRRKA